MTEWREVTIGDIAAPGRYGVVGGPFGSALGRKDYVDDGVPVIRGAQLAGPASFTHDDLVFVTEEKADRQAGNLARPGDVIVTQRGTVGQVGRIPSPAPFARYLLSQSQMKLTVDDSKADPRFMYYALLAPPAQAQLHGSTISAGVPHINLATFRGLVLELPPVPVQRRIANLLGGLDALIQNNQRRIELLEQMARAIYREWFVRFRYPGHEESVLLESPLGPIPEGWTSVRLADLVSTQYGYTESACDQAVGPRFLRGMDVNKRSYIDWSSVPYCPIAGRERAKFKVLPGDLFIIRMADPGKVGLCEVDVEAVFASYLVRLRPIDNSVTSYFLFFTLLEDKYQGWVTGASTGATRKSVSAKVMTEPLIVLPSKEIQARFGSEVEPIRSLLNSLVEGSSRLASIRDLLLPKLVTGQIDVSELNLDALTESVA